MEGSTSNWQISIKHILVPPGHNVAVTTAPRDYDYSYTRVLRTAEFKGKTYRVVAIPEERTHFQVPRYQSGNHLGVDWSEADKYLYPDELQELLSGIVLGIAPEKDVKLDTP